VLPSHIRGHHVVSMGLGVLLHSICKDSVLYHRSEESTRRAVFLTKFDPGGTLIEIGGGIQDVLSKDPEEEIEK